MSKSKFLPETLLFFFILWATLLVDYSVLLKSKRVYLEDLSIKLEKQLQFAVEDDVLLPTNEVALSDSEMSKLLDNMVAQVALSAMRIKAFKVGGIITEAFGYSSPIHLQMVGTFHDFCSFVSKMTSSPVGIQINKLQLKPLKQNKKERLKSPNMLLIEMQGQVNILLGLNQAKKDLSSVMKKKINQQKKMKPVYTMFHLRDPFLTPQQDQRPSGLLFQAISNSDTSEVSRSQLEPLTQFPLEQLSLVGIVKIHQKYIALIQDSQGYVHRISVNDRLGYHHGKVTSIDENMVYIEETIEEIGDCIQCGKTLKLKEI